MGIGTMFAGVSGLLFSGGFPWRFAMPLLREQQRLKFSLVSEQRDRGSFSTDVLATLTLFLLVLLNPAASQAVRPTPGVRALTSRAGASLSFVLLTPPAAPGSCTRSRALFQCGSRALRSAGFQLGRVRAPELPVLV